MSRSLALLVSAVENDLGPVAEAFPEGFFERAINEGQARYEPEILRRRVVTGVTIAEDATTYALPADAYDVEEFRATVDTSSPELSTYTIVDGTCYFARPVARDWTGIVIYRAHYPDVTDSQECLLPTAAMDGLISFALYRAFRRLAAGRAEYRRYATLTGNAVAMSDLEQAASIHLQDYEQARASAEILPDPAVAWQE